ncbi:MAG: hypothetical protein M3037_13540 [Gemmatimonadota bacterium]|nr:hypothetical protein [Gemmatimonadota bacterium]
MRFIQMVLATALAIPALSVAQEAASVPDWPLAPGLRVRIFSTDLGWRPKTGSVVSATSDTLMFLPAKQSTSTAIATQKIGRIDVARGTHTQKLQGAMLGLLAGAVAGAIIASASYKPPKCAADSWCMDILGQGGETAAGGVLGGLLGMLVGVIVGDRQTDNWVPVAVPAR